MKIKFVIFLHIGYWLIYLLLLSVIFSILTIQSNKTPSLKNLSAIFPLAILCIVPNFLSFYASYFLLFTNFLKQKRIALLVAFGTIVCLFSSLIAFLFSFTFFGINQPIFADPQEFFPLLIAFFFIAAVHGVIALVIRGFVGWFDEVRLKEELSRKNYETEMALLKSQLNPHFLFNTINNIDVLITKDSEKASDYLNKLSGILRYLLYDAKTEKIALSEEIKYIEKYIELQKIRTTNPNYVNFEVIGEPNGLQIAPMIFFPFIENAFKHTENVKKFNSINLKIIIKEKWINFECTNTYQNRASQKQEFGGLGNELIGKRLTLLYPNKHSLEIGDYDGIYKVKLMIEID